MSVLSENPMPDLAAGQLTKPQTAAPIHRPAGDHKRLILVIVCLCVLMTVGFIVRLKQQGRFADTKGEDLAITIVEPTIKASVPSEIAHQEEDMPGQYLVEPSETDVTVGDTITLSVYFDAPTKILDGADAVLIFDPRYVVVTDIIDKDESAYFDQMPKVNIDNDAGRIEITGFSPKDDSTPIAGKVLFFRVKMTAREPGTTRVDFVFSRGSTDQSTLVEKGTSRNILGSVEGVAFIIR